MFNEIAGTWKVGWIVFVAGLVGACQDYGFEEMPSSIFISGHQIQDVPLNPVDILFVVDNSGSMAGEQRQLGESFKAFSDLLTQFNGRYRIALVTTGLSSPGCKLCSSTNTLGCINVDAAGNSDIENGQFQYRRGHITWNGSIPEFDFQFDPTCRVVTGDNLSCFYDPTSDNSDGRGTVLVGTNGCGFERGLEAMKEALSGDLLGGPNKDFLRSDSSLAVIIVSDEDDCGAVGDVNELDGKDVYCYHAAKGESSTGQYEPLPPVDNYYQFLLRLKNNQKPMVRFAAIVGLTPPGKLDPNATTIQFDAGGSVIPACTTPCDNPPCSDTLRTALPGTRYRDLVNAFGTFGFIDTICQSDFSQTMEDIAHFVSCPRFFDLVEAPFDLGLANILINGVAVPRYSCTELVNGAVVECKGLLDTTTCSAGTCDATWTYQKPEDITDEVPPPVGGRINFAAHYEPCTLITQGTARIEIVYVVE